MEHAAAPVHRLQAHDNHSPQKTDDPQCNYTAPFRLTLSVRTASVADAHLQGCQLHKQSP
eukprot:33067-Pelagomonas_calceolata.AAC.6